MYKAKIKLTVNKVTYFPGDCIREKLRQTDEAFLLREGYIEKMDEPLQGKAKTAKKAPETKE